MTAVGHGLHHVRVLGSRLVPHRTHDRHAAAGLKDLSTLPVCGSGIRPSASQRALREP